MKKEYVDKLKVLADLEAELFSEDQAYMFTTNRDAYKKLLEGKDPRIRDISDISRCTFTHGTPQENISNCIKFLDKYYILATKESELFAGEPYDSQFRRNRTDFSNKVRRLKEEMMSQEIFELWQIDEKNGYDVEWYVQRTADYRKEQQQIEDNSECSCQDYGHNTPILGDLIVPFTPHDIWEAFLKINAFDERDVILYPHVSIFDEKALIAYCIQYVEPQYAFWYGILVGPAYSRDEKIEVLGEYNFLVKLD